MPTYTALEFEIEESFSKGDQSVTRKFFVDPWPARTDFLLDCLGGVRIVAGELWRQLPARDPTYTWLYAKECAFRPKDEEPGVLSGALNHLLNRAAYTTAVATVKYALLDQAQDSTDQKQDQQKEIDLGTIAWDFSARALKLPNSWFVWRETLGGANDGLVANSDANVTKVYPGFQLVITRHMVANKPTNMIISQLGRVNKNAITIQGDTYPKETLRFDSVKITRKYSNQGLKFFEMTYNFCCQPTYDAVVNAGTPDFVGWNRLYDPRKGYWRYVVSNTGNKKIYDYDEDSLLTQAIGGNNVAGFKYLFDPRAN